VANLALLARVWGVAKYHHPSITAGGRNWDYALFRVMPSVLSAPDRSTAATAIVTWLDALGTVPACRSCATPATGAQLAAEIHTIDGRPVAALVDSLRPDYPASNEPTRLRDMARNLTRGAGPVVLARVGAMGAFNTSVSRQPTGTLDRSQTFVRDLPGPTFRMLTDSVAYLKLSSVVAANTASYIEQAQRARVLVIDIRNYPSEFVVFALGGHLVSGASPFARFTVGDPSNPGAFRWGPTVFHTPRTPRFGGTVVILLDETWQSQAEYTAMAFQVAPGAIVVGSTTAGADGNVSRIPLPGNVEGMISGIGVFYPDGRPTQRIGIVPDLVVRPTVAGIRAGRDEVLEAGVSRALGRAFRLP
jgi:C-terminal processing protease CtpA/Prc